jgi:Tetratricopeptide repeat
LPGRFGDGLTRPSLAFVITNAAWLPSLSYHCSTSTAISLGNLAGLYLEQGQNEQAEPLYVRALAISEQQLGPLHPQTQIIRGNYSALLHTMRRDAETVELETKRMPPS